jgi:type III pantothenate kinase
MLLCDVGNTTYHFLDDEKDYKLFVKDYNPETTKEKVFYICVNQDIKAKLQKLNNWIDLSKFINMQNYYKTMGIDRIFACEAVDNKVVVDVGSAITVDIVKNHKFEGGFIYPGINAMQKTYENISNALSYSFNFELNLDKIPKNSADAISYGYLKTLYVEVMSYNMEILLTGGDALKFTSIFKNAKVDTKLIFRGMKKIINKANIC